MIRAKVRFNGQIEREIGALAKAISDLPASVLKRFGGYLRAKSKRRFQQQGPGWPDLKPETKAQKPDAKKIELLNVARGVGGKGGARLRRAGVLKLADQMARSTARAATSKGRTRERQLARAKAREEVLSAVVRHWGGAGRIKSVDDLVKFAEKDLATRIQRKHGIVGGARYRNEHSSTGILGALSRSVGWEIQGKKRLRVASKVPWAGVHNDGGTAGHGAREPKREFLVLDEEDFLVFDQIVAEEMEKRRSATHG